MFPAGERVRVLLQEFHSEDEAKTFYKPGCKDFEPLEDRPQYKTGHTNTESICQDGIPASSVSCSVGASSGS